jgi:glutathione reductase (NADPH)
VTVVADRFDLAVLGTGSAGSGVAMRCARAGWRVAIIESDAPGGTCALRGCDPKKVLVGAADAVDAMRRFRGRGPEGDVRIDWPALAAFKRSFTDPYPESKVAAFDAAGVSLVRGAARFVGPSSIAVDARMIEARHILVATGALPVPLGIPGAEHVTTSDRFLDLETLPSRIIFIGGGFISFEFAHVAVRAGSRVTVLHRGARPLERFDQDLVDRLVAHTRSLGVDMRLQAPVTHVASRDSGVEVRFATGGHEERLEGDLVVHGAGRVPALDRLDLGAGNVAFTAAGVTVNGYLQSVTNPSVWAAGDAAASGVPLTPVAGFEARVVAHNLLNGPSLEAEYPVVPSVVFTIPPLAMVGLSEADARARGLDVDVKTGDMSDWYSSRRVVEATAAFKTLVDRRNGRIVGAHVLGPHADETINLFALAMRNEMPADQFRQMLWAYPTHASDTAYMV